MRSLPNILPSVKFTNFGKFPVFLGKNRRKFGKSCSLRTALRRIYEPVKVWCQKLVLCAVLLCSCCALLLSAVA